MTNSTHETPSLTLLERLAQRAPDRGRITVDPDHAVTLLVESARSLSLARCSEWDCAACQEARNAWWEVANLLSPVETTRLRLRLVYANVRQPQCPLPKR